MVNFTLQITENAHTLTMLSVGQAYAEADAADAMQFQSLGLAVRAAWHWAHYSHILAVVGWLFTLYCVFYRGAMVPRALAAVGIGACLLHLAGITFPAFAGFRLRSPDLFGTPLGLANLVTAAWLMARGFKEPHATLPAASRFQARPAT